MTINPVQGLRAEAQSLSQQLQAHVGADWDMSTPAEGWTIRHQVAHLVSVYKLATAAVSDPERFEALLAGLSADFSANVEAAMAPLVTMDNEALIQAWNTAAHECVTTFEKVDPQQVVPWLVNPLPAGVLAMAGTVEAFAHGQDIRDGLDLEYVSSSLREICEFAYHTRTFGYSENGKDVPELDLVFDLTGPGGESWVIGDPASTHRITGGAHDFALLVTRRRNPLDLNLNASTPLGEEWLNVAQAYRGPAGPMREPLQRTVLAQ